MKITSFLANMNQQGDIQKRLMSELDKAMHDRLDHAMSAENLEATIAGSQAQLEGERAAIKICERRIARLQHELARMGNGQS